MRTDQSRQLKKLRAELLASLDEHNKSIQQLTLAQLSISRQLGEFQSSMTIIQIQNLVLRHLISGDIGSRRDQIYEADPDTCRWILEPGEGDDIYRKQISQDFINWLRTGNSVLHVSGNPGAGKSTLMKFVGEYPRTREELRVWAGNRQLLFGQFYFYAGIEEERTLLGMHKSLLFQVLSQCPGLIEHVFPRQWKKIKTSRFQADPSVEKFQSFGKKEIQEAFDALLSEVKKTDDSEYRLCFLIDGLDEFQGSIWDHENLATTLKSWATGGQIKFLVSSRPWSEFLTIFTDHPTLHLHHLNCSDIRTYAIRQLEQDRDTRQIGTYPTEKTIEDIVEALVDQAHGIFLWAHLVLDTVRRDIRRQYSFDLLKRKMREYPSGLDELYETLREPIEKSPIDRKLSNRMLLLAARAPKCFLLSALAFSWLPEDDDSGLLDPSFPSSTKCQPYLDQDIKDRLQCVAERVNGLTRGFLELVTVDSLDPIPGPAVRFCHRTARDYLINNTERSIALGESWPEFDQSDPYGRIYLAELIYCRASETPFSSEYLNEPFCRYFNFDTIRKFETPMLPLLKERWNEGYFERKGPSQTVSFLQYAAHCRLDRFVLSEVAKSWGAYPHPLGTSILLAAMNSAFGKEYWDYDLALDLLQSCVNRDSMIAAKVQVREPRSKHNTSEIASAWLLPVGVVALLLGLESIINDFSRGLNSRQDKFCVRYDEIHLHKSLVKMCRRLIELDGELGQKISVTVDSFPSYSSEGDAGTIFDGQIESRTFSADQILEWAKHLDARVGTLQDEVTEGLHQFRDWLLDTVRTIKEDRPIPISQDYRVLSWKWEAMNGYVLKGPGGFIWRVL